MARLKKLAIACSTSLLASGLTIWAFSPPASAAELLKDGGFEATTGGNSPDWTEADNVFGSPLCDSTCGSGGGTAGPRTGNWWAWFGGSSNAQTGSISQALTIPSGRPVTLTYYYWNGAVDSPYDSTLQVRMDGTPLKTHTETSAPGSGYTLQTLDLSAYANGASHTLSFVYNGGPAGSGVTNMSVDDVSVSADTEAPDTTLTTSPSGGVAKSLTVPFAFASTESGSTFNCSLDGAAFAPCSTPTSLTVSPGPHVFRVAARDAVGNTDATPATSSFTAYDCKSLDAKVAKAKKKVERLKKAIKNTEDPDKLDELDKKLKKAKKKLKKAKAAARPCHA